MTRPPSIQWYYKQYLGDNKVLAMDWDVRGMHVHLLMLSIQEEPPGTIPADDAAIRRWLSLPSGSVESDRTWRRVKSQLFPAWQPEGDRLVNSGMRASCERQVRYRDRYEIGTKKPPNLNADEDRSASFEVDLGSKKENELPDLDIQQATTFVFLEVGLAGNEARMLANDAVNSFIHNNKSSPKEAAESLVSLWNQYENTDLDFKKGVFKFFKEGLWKNPASWKSKLSEKEIFLAKHAKKAGA